MAKKITTLSVISGDIIASSKLEKKIRKNIPFILRNAFSKIKKYFPGDIEGDIDVFGGDSWQFVVKNVDKSVRIAVCFRLLLKSGIKYSAVDSKISIAIGEVDFISKNKLSESDGEAFRLSGRNLEKLNNKSYMYIDFQGFKKNEELSVILLLIDSIITRYTARQSLAVFGKLTGHNQEQIAKMFGGGIKQQSVSRHLNKAVSYPVEKSIEYFEYSLQRL